MKGKLLYRYSEDAVVIRNPFTGFMNRLGSAQNYAADLCQ